MNKKFSKNSNARRGGGRMLKLRFDWYITTASEKEGKKSRYIYTVSRSPVTQHKGWRIIGMRKIQVLGNFCSDLEVSEAFGMSLEISFSCISLRLGFLNFWPRGLGVSDFYLLANGFDQTSRETLTQTANSLFLFLACDPEPARSSESMRSSGGQATRFLS